MPDIDGLNSETKEYLNKFYDILDEMVEEMTGAPLTNSISHNFIVQMIPHHRAAIEMSVNILSYSENNALRGIAANIIAYQKKGIEDMRRILLICSSYKNDENSLRLYEKRFKWISSAMFYEMGNSYADNNIDADFMREMIPHHRGAIRMCENLLSFEICPELKPVAEKIILTQKRGISDMEKLLESIE